MKTSMMSQPLETSAAQWDRPAPLEGRAKPQASDWVARTLNDAAEQGLVISETRATTGRLALQLIGEIGLTTPDAHGLDRQTARLSAVVARHWMSRTDAKQSFEAIALGLLSRTIGGRKVDANVLRETVLVEAVAQHDSRAIEVFMTSYQAVLMRLLYQAGGQRAVQELEDLITQVVERPERYLDGYKGAATLARWLSTIARSAWVSLTRAQNREERRQASFRVLHPSAGESASYADTILGDEATCHQALFEIARKALESLTDRETLMLRMVLLDGVTQAQVARTFGCDKATITRSMTRARTRIQQRVDELIESSSSVPASALRESIERISGTPAGDTFDLGSCLARLLQDAGSTEAVPA